MDIQPAHLDRIAAAQERLKRDPDEAVRMAERAASRLRDALSLTIDGADVVLAIWEYLDRTVPLVVIDAALEQLGLGRRDSPLTTSRP